MAKSTLQTSGGPSPKTPPPHGVPDETTTIPVSALHAGRLDSVVTPATDTPPTSVPEFRPATQDPQTDVPGVFQDRCDLCSGLLEASPSFSTARNAQLCGHCFKHFNALPQGKIRECLERFMLGNVV